MKQPLVSFIIPVLNGENDIARCLLSIASLRYPVEDYEVVIMDNGSTDRTLQIIQELGFTAYVEKGVTVGALRNRGVGLAHGSYIAFVDSDVELTPHWLQKGLAAFRDLQVVAAGCFPTVPSPSTWVQRTWDIHQRRQSTSDEARPVSWLPSMNLLVRRENFLAVGGFNEQLQTAEDVDLCYRLGKEGKILGIPTMEAIHWGEAPDIKTFWRKEVWRGTGNLMGVFAHGVRWDELPSVGYPLYILSVLLFLLLGGSLDMQHRQLAWFPVAWVFSLLPSVILAFNTARQTRQFRILPQLVTLYFVYGAARAYSLVKVYTKR